MSKYANKVVEQAKSWIGKKESNGTHKTIIDLYNSHKPLARGYKVKYTDAWCATFVSAVAIKLGYTDIIPTECGCEQMIQLFKRAGTWEENDNITPKAGDIIFYDWQDSGSGDNRGTSDHVGIVESVTNGMMTIIEGNINNSVGRRNIAVGARFIRGYGRPKYGTETNKTPTVKKSIEDVAKEVLAGKWGNGAERKKKLTDAGYHYNTVQSMVNKLSSGSATKKSVEEIAKEVIAGKWGSGATRKAKLESAGYNYNEIQKKVNQLMK